MAAARAGIPDRPRRGAPPLGTAGSGAGRGRLARGPQRGGTRRDAGGVRAALRCRWPWAVGELALWRRRAGIHETLDTDAVAEPHAAELRGEWARAAELWTELGCPYEAALALAEAEEEEPLRRALADLQRLGARPAAAIVARRLRERGAHGLPRGPRAATRANPAGLTRREVEVLALLGEGLRNAGIAERLFVTTKTVDHHVSAILRKLEVGNRGEAAAEAIRLGISAASGIGARPQKMGSSRPNLGRLPMRLRPHRRTFDRTVMERSMLLGKPASAAELAPDGARERAVLAAFLTNALLAGGNAVGIRFSNRELDPLWGASLRFALAAVLLCALMAALGWRSRAGGRSSVPSFSGCAAARRLHAWSTRCARTT